MHIDSILYHPDFRPIRRLVNGLRLSSRLNAGAGSLCLEINSAEIGFFAQLTWCLHFLAFCEDRLINPKIRLTGSIYADTPNHDWFHDFFEDRNPIALSAGNSDHTRLRPLVVKHIDETSLSGRYHQKLTLEEAHRLFTKHFRVNEQIQSYIDNFVATEFAGDAVIGLHFRGTDKKWEAQPVEWPRCFQSVMKLAADRPEVKKVFVASDEMQFIDWFAKQAKGSLSVVVHPDEERSREGKPVHLNQAGNHPRKAFEALVNCLLLSRCTALIRTVSFLSGWSSVFSPALPITLLNRPFEYAHWFPDRECLKRSDSRYS